MDIIEKEIYEAEKTALTAILARDALLEKYWDKVKGHFISFIDDMEVDAPFDSIETVYYMPPTTDEFIEVLTICAGLKNPTRMRIFTASNNTFCEFDYDGVHYAAWLNPEQMREAGFSVARAEIIDNLSK